MNCECDMDVLENYWPNEMYLPQEQKAMLHKAHACPGDYNMQHRVRNGKLMWLCSCCQLTTDGYPPNEC